MGGDHLPLAGVGLRAGDPGADLADLLEVAERALAVDRSRSGGHGGIGLQRAEPGGEGDEQGGRDGEHAHGDQQAADEPLPSPA